MKPFIKWAGGKRSILPELLKRVPDEYGTYYEPFVGGGTLLFALQPEYALLNDANDVLVYAYRNIAFHTDDVYGFLVATHNAAISSRKSLKEVYTKIRSDFNQRLADKDLRYTPLTTSLFLWLNRFCFNGLYRVNSKGEFNTPCGITQLYDHDFEKDEANIRLVSKYLRTRCLIGNRDFEEDYCNTTAKEGDFVYLDPPYDPETNHGFRSYTKNGFTDEDQERLAQMVDALTGNGVKVLLSVSNTPFMRELYKLYTIEEVQAKRNIAANAKFRGNKKELLIRNY